jgi:hypothetical protein
VATTTNYGWPIPTVDGDADAWGAILNTLAQLVDTQVKAVQDSIPVGPPPGNGPVILAKGDVVHAATFLTIDLSAFIAGYKRFEIKLNRVNCGNTSTSVAARFSTDAGATWLTTGYGWRLAILSVAYATQTDGGSSTELRLQSGAGFAHGTIELSLLSDAVVYSHMSSGSFTPTACICAGANTTPGINAIKLYSVGGTALAGSYDLVGYP